MKDLSALSSPFCDRHRKSTDGVGSIRADLIRSKTTPLDVEQDEVNQYFYYKSNKLFSQIAPRFPVNLFSSIGILQFLASEINIHVDRNSQKKFEICCLIEQK